MFVTTACSACQGQLRVWAPSAGQRRRCPRCGAGFVVSLPAAAGPAPEGPSPPAVTPPPPPARALGRLGTAAAVLLPLGLPVLTRGGALGFGLGAGLAGLTLALALRRWWSPRVRCLVLAADGAAYGLAGLLLLGPAVEPPALAEGEGRRPPALPPRPGAKMGSEWFFPLPPLLRSEPVPVGERTRADNHLRFDRTLGALLSLAVAPEQGAAFVSAADGSLRHYAYPAWELRATYTLARPAYQAAVDGERGLLYLAVSDPDALVFNSVGDREGARGDLEVYDLRALVKDEGKAGGRLRPLRTVPVAGDVSHLTLAPGGDWLYFLANRGSAAHVGRLPTAGGEAHTASFKFGAVGLTLAPDGRALYVAGVGRLMALDPETLRITAAVSVFGVGTSVVADRAGRVFLSHRSRVGEVTVLDMSRPSAALRHWSVPLPGRLSLQLSPDEKVLVVSSSSLTGNRIWALDVGGDWAPGVGDERPAPPEVIGDARGDAAGPVRGPSFLTPDGRFLVNRRGKVFRLGKSG